MRFFFSWPLGVSDLANNMHRYVQAMERQIEVLVQKQHAITQTATSEVEHDMQYMLLGEMEETFPRNLRYGTLVTIYATVEQSIRSACYLTGEVVGGPFTEPKRGGMLEGAAAYLARTLGVQIIKDRITWTPVKALRTLRHCIVRTSAHRDRPDRCIVIIGIGPS